MGEWASASESLVPANKAWGTDPTTGEVWRVTTVIRDSALQVYPPSMVDVPDLDVPLATDDPSGYLQEANARHTDAMAQMAHDYLGAYWLYDEAAGAKGMLRILLQKEAPYNNLAVFEIDHPTTLAGDGVPRLPHWMGSYPTTTAANGQEVQSTYVVGGTYRSWSEKAEGNCVTVYGTAIGADANAAGSSDAALLVSNAVNVHSYNFLGLAPEDDGYPVSPRGRRPRVPQQGGGDPRRGFQARDPDGDRLEVPQDFRGGLLQPVPPELRRPAPLGDGRDRRASGAAPAAEVLRSGAGEAARRNPPAVPGRELRSLLHPRRSSSSRATRW